MEFICTKCREKRKKKDTLVLTKMKLDKGTFYLYKHRSRYCKKCKTWIYDESFEKFNIRSFERAVKKTRRAAKRYHLGTIIDTTKEAE